jgi:CubicO group peptidase (beta-lactamase class C family)
MSRQLIVLAALVATVSLAQPAVAGRCHEEAAPQCPELSSRLDAYVQQAVTDWEVPGLAIAVVKDGETVFARGYGVRELGGEAPVDEHTLFAIGSTTKAMTAAAIGMLVDEGKLDWDSRVTDLLPGFELASPWMTRELTVRDLLTHRAGLGNADMLWYRTGREPADILHRVRYVPQAYSPRSSFIYQNLMYATAGAVVTEVSGMPWAEFVRSRIFAPLGMEGTVPLLAETIPLDNVAIPHDRVDGELQAIENASVDNVDAAGSVWSSVADMAKWANFMLGSEPAPNSPLLQPRTRAELLTPQTIVTDAAFYPTAALTRPHWKTYSLGWFQHDYEGRAVSFHTGSIDGMVAIIGLIPDEELGVYVLANRDHAEVRHALMYKVFDLWGGRSDGRDWSAELRELYADLEQRGEEAATEQRASRIPDTSPSLALSAYSGLYVDELYGEIEISETDGLRLSFGELSADLGHWHHDTFEARWRHAWMGTMPVSFTIGIDGKVATLSTLGREFHRRD